MLTLNNTIDRLLQESLRHTSDEKILFRSRIIVGVTLMYFLSMVSVALILTLFIYLNVVSVWPAVISCVFSSSCYFLQIIYFKKTGNLFIASAITMSILVFFTTVFTYMTGGWNSPVILFLFVAPMCAFLITGHKAGIFWSALSVFIYLFLGGLEFNHVATPHIISNEYESLLIFFCWIFSWFMIVGGVTLYSTMVNSLNASINHEKEKLRLKVTFDESSGAYTRKAFDQMFIKKIQGPNASMETFALAFIELAHNAESSKKNTDHMLRFFITQAKNHLSDKIILSRYGNLSITALITDLENEDTARRVLNELYADLQYAMDKQGMTLMFGAVIALNHFSDLNAISESARNALLVAKEHDQKFVVCSIGARKTNTRDYRSKIVVATFDQIVKKNYSKK